MYKKTKSQSPWRQLAEECHNEAYTPAKEARGSAYKYTGGQMAVKATRPQTAAPQTTASPQKGGGYSQLYQATTPHKTPNQKDYSLGRPQHSGGFGSYYNTAQKRRQRQETS